MMYVSGARNALLQTKGSIQDDGMKEENKMSEFENKEAIELSLEEMNEVAGGYKPLAPKKGLSLEEMNEVAGGYKPLAPKKGYIVYQIAKGDTLRKIADKFKVKIAEIISWNPKITNRNLIYAGDYLYIKQK